MRLEPDLVTKKYNRPNWGSCEKSGEKLFEYILLVTADNEFERDTEEDSDESVKAPPKKKTKQGVFHKCEDDDHDDDDGEDKRKMYQRLQKQREQF